MKKDPFDAKSPQMIKENILNLRIDDFYVQNIPDFFKPLLQFILTRDENERPAAQDVITYLQTMKGNFIKESLKNGIEKNGLCK